MSDRAANIARLVYDAVPLNGHYQGSRWANSVGHKRAAEKLLGRNVAWTEFDHGTLAQLGQYNITEASVKIGESYLLEACSRKTTASDGVPGALARETAAIAAGGTRMELVDLSEHVRSIVLDTLTEEVLTELALDTTRSYLFETQSYKSIDNRGLHGARAREMRGGAVPLSKESTKKAMDILQGAPVPAHMTLLQAALSVKQTRERRAAREAPPPGKTINGKKLFATVSRAKRQ